MTGKLTGPGEGQNWQGRTEFPSQPRGTKPLGVKVEVLKGGKTFAPNTYQAVAEKIRDLGIKSLILEKGRFGIVRAAYKRLDGKEVIITPNLIANRRTVLEQLRALRQKEMDRLNESKLPLSEDYHQLDGHVQELKQLIKREEAILTMAQGYLSKVPFMQKGGLRAERLSADALALHLVNQAVFNNLERDAISANSSLRDEKSSLSSTRDLESATTFSDVGSNPATRIHVVGADKKWLPLHMNQFKGAERDFLLSQYPSSDQFKERFWMAVAQGEVSTIVNLATPQDTIPKYDPKTREWKSVETEKNPYWGKKGETIRLSDGTKIKLVKENKVQGKEGDYIVREFRVRGPGENKSRMVRQIQFTGWPDKGVPLEGQFDKMLGTIEKMEQGGPMIVHCKAGVGRTGTVVTALNERAKMRGSQKGSPKFSLDKAIIELRSARGSNKVVQTAEQYRMLDESLERYRRNLGTV